ncbi:hypothetical protein [Geotalea sp. SG265]|uniref:hypothetical protein n=1 Tax=Geotalea sp. SG265 TaxID=2922867 RepID=UPI001FAFB8BE|nr:hypothetical protein [Geotalea sp. SG265]
MSELQLHERIEVALKMKITWPGKGTVFGTTRYVSDDETLLVADFEEVPAPGTEMLLQLDCTVLGREAPVVKATVLRAERWEIVFRLPVENAD